MSVRLAPDQSMATLWPALSDDVARVHALLNPVRAEPRPLSPAPVQHPFRPVPTSRPLPLVSRIAGLAVGERTTVYGSPRFYIERARALVSGDWSSTHKGELTWIVERTA